MTHMTRSKPFCSLVFVIWSFYGAVEAASAKDNGGWSEPKKNGEGKVVQELKIEAPSFTEEDQYGYIMPERYRCDSCRAVMFHIEDGLKKTHPKSRRMKQWEYTDAFDDICKTAFGGYGVKLINGENTLSGPGLTMNEAQLSPGSGAIQMGGESWSKRLSEICRKIVYEKVGEEELYDFVYKRLRAEGDQGGDAGEKLCREEIRECEWRPQAGPKTPPVPEKLSASDAKTKTKAEKAKDKAKEKKKTEAAKAKAAAAKAKADAAASSTSPASKVSRKGAGTDEVVDAQTFLSSLAVRHGLTSDEYLASRTVADWERLTVAMAGRIFNKLAASEPDESCRA